MARKFLLGVAAAALMAGSASAEDIPVFAWSGFYAGVNTGYINGSRTHVVGSPVYGNDGTSNCGGCGGGGEEGPPPAARSFKAFKAYESSAPSGGSDYNVANALAASSRGSDLSAILGGGGIGYNWQFGTIVFGLETDLQATSRSRETSAAGVTTPAYPVTGMVSSSQHFNYIGTVRGRLGYTVLDNLLVYVTGGLAYGEKQVQTSLQLGFPYSTPSLYGATFSRSKTETGYTVGGGLEYMLDTNWSVKAEALYYDLGKTRTASQFNTYTTNCNSTAVFTTTGVNTSTDNKGVIARFGVNYKFTSW